MKTNRLVIVGGGLSGLISYGEAFLNTSSVDLVEKSSSLGGVDRTFTIDVNAENAAFLQTFGIDASTLTSENACSVLREKLIAHLKSQPVKDVRVILNAEVTSILTDSEQKRALGLHYKRLLETKGRSYQPEANVFGDALVFAISRDAVGSLCTGGICHVEENLLFKAQGQEALSDVYVSKAGQERTVSLNDFITDARKAAKLACESEPKKVVGKGLKQPLPFVDKAGVFHGVALKPEEWVPFHLENRIQLNKFNHLFRFALPEKNQQSGLFCGQYIAIRTFLEGKEVVRYYSPVSRNSDYGHLDLMIKIEVDTTNKPMEKFMSELKVGDIVEFKGPMGGFEYHRNMYREVGMIAGGTGITPMVQIIRSVANHPEDDTNIKLLYGNYNEDDILCRDELSYYTLTRTNIKVYISLVNAPGKWSMGTGFITKEMVTESLPAPANDIIILLCGPPPMIKANIVMLKEMGYTDQMIFSFV